MEPTRFRPQPQGTSETCLERVTLPVPSVPTLGHALLEDHPSFVLVSLPHPTCPWLQTAARVVFFRTDTDTGTEAPDSQPWDTFPLPLA